MSAKPEWLLQRGMSRTGSAENRQEVKCGGSKNSSERWTKEGNLERENARKDKFVHADTKKNPLDLTKLAFQ